METKPSLVYLAGPYTHGDAYVRLQRYVQLTKISSMLIEMGVVNFSPITQSHHQNMFMNMKGTWANWRKVDLEFLSRCDEIWVAKLPGWKQSVGVKAEVEFAKKHAIPVKYITFNEKNLTLKVSK